MPTPQSTYSRIYSIIRRIPAGQVATYGQIATLAGLPKHPRLVGYALRRPEAPRHLPWHRVVNAQGKISFSPGRNSSDHQQCMLLEAEGIVFNQKGKFDLKQYQWKPPQRLGGKKR